MIRTCPFASGIDANGKPSLSPCVSSCALQVDGKCAFVLISEELAQLHPTTNHQSEAKED